MYYSHFSHHNFIEENHQSTFRRARRASERTAFKSHMQFLLIFGPYFALTETVLMDKPVSKGPGLFYLPRPRRRRYQAKSRTITRRTTFKSFIRARLDRAQLNHSTEPERFVYLYFYNDRYTVSAGGSLSRARKPSAKFALWRDCKSTPESQGWPHTWGKEVASLWKICKLSYFLI